MQQMQADNIYCLQLLCTHTVRSNPHAQQTIRQEQTWHVRDCKNHRVQKRTELPPDRDRLEKMPDM